MKKLILSVVSFTIFCFLANGQTNRIVTNPINLNYRFQYDGSYREAADPVCEYFEKKGKYYLFASKSGGYWSSTDLADWTFIPCTSIAELDRYAPTIMIIGDWIYLTTANAGHIYRTNNPDTDNWEQLNTQCNIPNDPAFFQNDDGKVYIYGGCSDWDAIKGYEVDPNDNFKQIGQEKSLIPHNPDIYGWERQGNNNDGGTGWNEGPCMTKYKGKYYLQYASPGTQYRTYADGVYVGNHPLGPFTYQENSPFSLKTGGFIGGAGHGHTFKDKYGNYWHVATMSISQRHSFERRIALFPVFFDEDDQMYARTEKGDYPFSVPDAKVNFQTDDRSMPWNLLSCKKTATASSSYESYSSNKANDEAVETWWSAATGNIGEYWQVDLGKTMTVNAIHVNFADQDFTTRAPSSGENISFVYLYSIEISANGDNWTMLVDKTANTKGTAHDLIVLDVPVETRYLRINNAKALPGKFSLFDFRVFGTANGELPNAVTGVQVTRETDKRRFQIQWNEQENVTGYIVRWGIQPDKLNYSTVVYTNRIASNLGDNIVTKTYCPSGSNVTTSGPPVTINGDIIEHMNGNAGAFFEYANVEGGAGGLSEICLKYSKGWDQVTRICVSVNENEPFYVNFPGNPDWSWSLYKEVCVEVMLNAGATNKIRFTVCDDNQGINGGCLTVKYPAGDDDFYEFEAGYFNADVSSYYFAIDAFNENGITRGITGPTTVTLANKEKTITFYPNPASEHLTFYTPEKALLLIYNLSGRLMGQYNLKQDYNTISVVNYPKGEYLFEVRSINGSENGKWVKK